MVQKKSIVLKHFLCPGDITVMTSIPRDIYRAYGDRYQIGVWTNHPHIWQNNPFIYANYGPDDTPQPGVPVVQLDYDVKLHKTGKHHFLHAYLQTAIEGLKAHGIEDIPLTELRPYFKLDDDEEKRKPMGGADYWLICAGGKYDCAAKWWDPEMWKQLAGMMNCEKTFPPLVQIGTVRGANHPKIKGTINRVGQTNLRTLIWLVAHCKGVICGVTAVMHMAAAFGKPCVVVAGGREPWWWDSYDKRALERHAPAIPEKYQQLLSKVTPHLYLDSLGKYSCCKEYGCWKRHIGNKIGDENCENIVRAHRFHGPSIPQAQCMRDITPQHVRAAIMKYHGRSVK